ncbi:MAG: VCBS repeat-containing protein [Planctomycetota bacterium]
MDLNGDGLLDILSGSWPGELFLFLANDDKTFDAPVMLQDRDGEYINIGGGIEEEPDGSILITGHADFETTAEGTLAVYHGKRIKWTPQKPVAITGSASAVHASDWDDDGDYDLIIGDIGGNVYLILNEGTPESWAFGKHTVVQAGDRPLRVSRNAAPFAADWDGDGDLDLLLGAGDGSVSWCRNTGSAESATLAAAVELVPPGRVSYGKDVPREVARGTRSRICAADWNGDGLLDLLVGDYTTQKPDLPEPTAEEKAVHERTRKELDAVTERHREVADKLFGDEPVKSEDERKKLQQQEDELRRRMSELRALLPREYDSHGWVWLFLREKSLSSTPPGPCSRSMASSIRGAMPGSACAARSEPMCSSCSRTGKPGSSFRVLTVRRSPLCPATSSSSPRWAESPLRDRWR